MLLLAAFVAPNVLGQQAQARRDGQRGYPPQMKGAKVEVYKSIGDGTTTSRSSRRCERLTSSSRR
jgi:hypothetical protein